MGTLESVPFNKLLLDESNIRISATNPERDAELKASILASGILQNLVVTVAPRGKRLVRAGGRRYRQLKALVDEKSIPKDYPVPCHVLDKNDNAEQAALIENTMRDDMHPVDEYESYSRLHYVHHKSIEEIAATFGRSQVDVEKRLKLGTVAPQLREVCRNGDISVDVLAAFTATEDHQRQMEAYESAKDRFRIITPHAIREYLNNEAYRSDHQLIKLLDEEEYIARGGKVSSDLFVHTKYYHDRQLVDDLVKERLTQESEALLADGWKWADIDLEYFNNPITYPKILDPHPARPSDIPPELLASKQEATQLVEKLNSLMDAAEEEEGFDYSDEHYQELEDKLSAADDERCEIEEEISKLDTFTDEQKSISGCVITIDNSGLKVLKGRVKKSDMMNLDGPDKKTESNDPSSVNPETESEEFSRALTQDLLTYRLAALQLDLYYSSHQAADLLLFSIIWGTLQSHTEGGYRYSNPPVMVTSNFPDRQTSVEDERTKTAYQELKSCRESLNLSWLDFDDMTGSFVAFKEEVTPRDREKILAWCAAMMLRDPSDDMYRELVTSCQTNIAKYWRPTASNYFKRAPRKILLSNGQEIFDDEKFAHQYRAKSKGDIAHILSEKIEQMPVGECWLPSIMRIHDAAETDAQDD